MLKVLLATSSSDSSKQTSVDPRNFLGLRRKEFFRLIQQKVRSTIRNFVTIEMTSKDATKSNDAIEDRKESPLATGNQDKLIEMPSSSGIGNIKKRELASSCREK